MTGDKKRNRTTKKGGSQTMTILTKEFIDKLKAHNVGDVFIYDGKKYEVLTNKHYKQVGGKTRRKKSNRRTEKRSSKK